MNMKRIAQHLCLATAVVMGVFSTQAIAEQKVISGNLRIVIGSTSTGGDTYQVSAIVAEALSKKLDINAKVDAVGPTAAFQAISRSGADGSTIMLFHDQAYLGYLYGVRGFSDILADYMVGPTVAINPGDAFLVPAKSPYKTIEDVIQAAGKGTRVRVAVQPGGVSEIGFTAMKNAVKVRYPGKESNMVRVNTGSQADKNQLLFDGQADVINGSVQANEQYTRLPADDQKAMRFIWIPARKQTLDQANPEGMGQTSREQLLAFATPKATVTQDGKKNWAFDKEFFFLYNKDMKPEVVAALDKALTEIYAEGKIQETLKKSFFIPNFMPSKEAQAYLKEKITETKKVIDSIK
jgi:tripartite-type tricarboxylate transporter receptor subunit TctC